MFVFDYAGVGDVALGIIHHGVALIIWFVDDFLLEADRSIVEFAEAIAVELIYFSGKDNLVGNTFPISPVIKEVGVGSCLNAVKQSVKKFILTSNGYALILVVEIIIVENEANG